MQLSLRPVLRLVVATVALSAFVPASSQAQQPVPLRLSAPPAHTIVIAEPQAPVPVQTLTAQGELLDVNAKTNTLTVKAQSGEMTFRFTEDTKATGTQQGVTDLATMTGSQVTVTYRRDRQANLATSIDVKANGK